MRRVHPISAPTKGRNSILTAGLIPVLLVMLVFGITGCDSTSGAGSKSTLPITILVDNSQVQTEITSGETVQNALDKAGVLLESLDEVTPPTYTILSEVTEIRVTRVREEFEMVETVIPFVRQTVRNESLPEGDTLLIQPGVNGLQQDTYRLVYEDDVISSRNLFKSEIITEAKPEIVMIGVQTPYMPVAIEGKIAYLTAGNAWLMEDNTGSRRPLVTSGDLDGRIFSLSPDGGWLLFTRSITDEESEDINSLWVINVNETDAEPHSLKARNIITFADWIPNTERQVIYSTVEPREAAPGYQATNDLQRVVFAEDGTVMQIKEMVAANEGGPYGTWGTQFTWSSDGKRLAYTTANEIGLVDLNAGTLEPVMQIVPLQTGGDWVWLPGMSWSPDHRVLFTIIHSSSTGDPADELSPYFDLVGVLPAEKIIVTLEQNTGMFSYPVSSPYYDGERIQVAYLRALNPEQSESSSYELVIMDRDGSNKKTLFPTDGSSGIEPQQVAWEPGYSDRVPTIAFIYQDNLWLVFPESGKAQPVTGDGTISKMDWK